MPVLTAEQIKAETAKRRKFEDVPVEALGGDVRLLALTAGDVVALNAKEDRREVSFEYVARSWSTVDNLPLFPPNEKGEWTEGIAVAKSLEDDACALLLKRVLRMNGVGEKAIEDAGKN